MGETMNLYGANSLFLFAADGGALDFGRGEYAPNANNGADFCRPLFVLCRGINSHQPHKNQRSA